jgi:hypothetical protein
MKKILVGGIIGLALFGVALATNFPASVSTDSNLYVAVNNCYTTLSVTISISTPIITAAATTNFPSVGYMIIGNEVIKYTGKTSTTFTGCSRGSDGTAAASHTAGLVIYHSIVAAHHNVLKDEVIGLENYFLTGSLLHLSTATSFVGINNASPAYALDVGGGINLTGAVTAGTSVNGASATFTGVIEGATINTGNGANESYPMDQAVRTTDSPTFANATATYGISAATLTTSGLATVNTLKVTNGASLGYLMTSDADGDAVWSPQVPLGAIGMDVTGADNNAVLYTDGSGNLDTDATLGFTGSLFTAPATTLTGTLTINGNATSTGTLTANGFVGTGTGTSFTITNSTVIISTTSGNYGIRFQDNTFQNTAGASQAQVDSIAVSTGGIDARIDGLVLSSGTFDAAGDYDITGIWTFESSTTFNGNVTSTGTVTIGTFTTTGASTFNGNVTSTGTVTAGELDVQGDIVVSGTVDGVDVSAIPSTYLTQSSATLTYLQNSSATATYLTKSSAAATYLTAVPSSSTFNFIHVSTLEFTSALYFMESFDFFGNDSITYTDYVSGVSESFALTCSTKCSDLYTINGGSVTFNKSGYYGFQYDTPFNKTSGSGDLVNFWSHIYMNGTLVSNVSGTDDSYDPMTYSTHTWVNKGDTIYECHGFEVRNGLGNTEWSAYLNIWK